MLRLPCLICLVALGACTFDFDAVGPTAAGGHGGAGTSQGAASPGGGEPIGGAPTCAADSGACITIPTGFGPVTQLRPAGTCGGEVLFTGAREDTPITSTDAQAECGCACVFADDVCTNVEVHSQASCALDGIVVTAAADKCTNLSSLSARALDPQEGGANGAKCESNGIESTVPEASFAELFDGCAVVSELECGDGVCLPAGDETYCLLSQGATQCPPDFAVAHRLLDDGDILDTRKCACFCLVDGNVTCLQPTIKAYPDAGCEQVQLATTGAGCKVASQVIGGIVVSPTISGACEELQVKDGEVSVPSDAGALLCCTK